MRTPNMKLQDKLAAVKREVEFITKHDDAKVEEVREALKSVRAIVAAAEDRLVKRRLGTYTQRVVNYFVNVGKAVRGAE